MCLSVMTGAAPYVFLHLYCYVYIVIFLRSYLYRAHFYSFFCLCFHYFFCLCFHSYVVSFSLVYCSVSTRILFRFDSYTVHWPHLPPHSGTASCTCWRTTCSTSAPSWWMRPGTPIPSKQCERTFYSIQSWFTKCCDVMFSYFTACISYEVSWWCLLLINWMTIW